MTEPTEHEIELAERLLLGCMLLEPIWVDRLMSDLGVGAFEEREHAFIYSAMRGLRELRRTVDAITVADALEERDRLDEIGSATFLIELMESVPEGYDVEVYADIVRGRKASPYAAIMN